MKENKIKRATSIITINVVFSLFVFVLLMNCQYFDNNYVYAFKPSNAPNTKTSSISENMTKYHFIKKKGG
jgi:hypothetical protein